jgi:hypothetical protein
MGARLDVAIGSAKGILASKGADVFLKAHRNGNQRLAISVDYQVIGDTKTPLTTYAANLFLRVKPAASHIRGSVQQTAFEIPPHTRLYARLHPER